ncbi:MAG: hypothetical protein LUG19_04265, partial [Desulfovibrio sp.]|uniref:hypothetical protein n=1 Tax=Desulfovibrio sp. TaxID=885 RepID=UPI0025830DE6
TGRSWHCRCTAPHGHTNKSLSRLEKGLRQNFLIFFSIKYKNDFISMCYIKMSLVPLRPAVPAAHKKEPRKGALRLLRSASRHFPPERNPPLAAKTPAGGRF